jgi:hypothetical protein
MAIAIRSEKAFPMQGTCVIYSQGVLTDLSTKATFPWAPDQAKQRSVVEETDDAVSVTKGPCPSYHLWVGTPEAFLGGRTPS